MELSHFPDGQVIPLKELLAMLPFSKSTLYVELAAGRFPRPISLSRRARGWLAGDLKAWLGARARESAKSSTRLVTFDATT